MLSKLKNLFRSEPASAALPPLPPGERIYAIGDVHGRADLLSRLIEKIELDESGREPAATTIIFLGDLIDRGPDSADVIEQVITLSGRRNVRTIAGNHEEMFLASFESDAILRKFLEYGGRDTILSYFSDREEYSRLTIAQLRKHLPSVLPPHHLAFLRSLEDRIQIGNYLFVHAGVRPGVDLDDQRTSDLRWIRTGFLDCDDDFGAIVVHGHTISQSITIRKNRIGIDTGAYLHGVLSAVAFENAERWFLQAEG